jgi:hypothetical protein
MSTEGKSRRFYLVNLTWVIMIWALLSACGTEPQPPAVETSPPATQPSVQVIPDDQVEKQLISTETIHQNHCSGGSISNQITRSYAISHTVSLGGSVSVNANGEVGIPGIGNVQVGSQIAATYGKTYGEQETLSRTITVSADPGSNVNYEIQQYEIWKTGVIVITDANKEVGRYPYKFRTDFGLEAVDPPKALDCPSPIDDYIGTWIYPYYDPGTLSFALHRLIITPADRKKGTAIVSVCQCTAKYACNIKRKLKPEDAGAHFDGTKLVLDPVFFFDENGKKAQWMLEVDKKGEQLHVTVQQDNGSIPSDYDLELEYVSTPTPSPFGNITSVNQDECLPPPEALQLDGTP